MANLSLKPTPKGKILTIIIASVIFLGGIIGYVISSRNLNKVYAKVEEKEKHVVDAEEIAKTLEQSKLIYMDAYSQIRCLESSVSTQAYIPTLLKQIENLAKSVKLNVQSVRPIPIEVKVVQKAADGSKEAETVKTEEKLPPYDEQKIDLEVEGRYMDALAFVYKLNSFPKIIAVNSVQMTPNCRDSFTGTPNLKISMSITAFILKEEHKSGDNSTTSAMANVQGGKTHESG